jgi:hypothetical protein
MKFFLTAITVLLLNVCAFCGMPNPPRLGIALGTNGLSFFGEARISKSLSFRVGGEIVNSISPGLCAGLSFNPKLMVFRNVFLEGALSYSYFYKSDVSYEIDNTFLTYQIGRGNYVLPQIELSWYGKKGSEIEHDQMFNFSKIHFYFGRTFFLNTVSVMEENKIYLEKQNRIMEKRFDDRFIFGFAITCSLNAFSKEK